MRNVTVIGGVLFLAACSRTEVIQKSAWDQAAPTTKQACAPGATHREVTILDDDTSRATVLVCGVTYLCTEIGPTPGFNCVVK